MVTHTRTALRAYPSRPTLTLSYNKYRAEHALPTAIIIGVTLQAPTQTDLGCFH